MTLLTILSIHLLNLSTQTCKNLILNIYDSALTFTCQETRKMNKNLWCSRMCIRRSGVSTEASQSVWIAEKKNSWTLHQHLKSLDLKCWTNLTWLSHATTGGLPCPIWQTLQTCPWAQDFNPSHQRRQTLYLIQPEHEEVPHPYKFIQHLLAFFSSFSPFPSDILAYLRKQPDAHPGFRYSFNFLLETHLCLVMRLT